MPHHEVIKLPPPDFYIGRLHDACQVTIDFLPLHLCGLGQKGGLSMYHTEKRAQMPLTWAKQLQTGTTYIGNAIESLGMARSIRLATVADAAEMASIYSHFVLNTPVSFESVPPDEAEIRQRISNILAQYPWLVVEIDGAVAGYAYASQHRARYHYQWSVDVTVYVHEAFRRQGIGKALYTSLLAMIPLQGYVAAFAGITLPNPGSVGLHEAHGFTPVGIYKNVGFKLGKWHDVGWWQKTLIDPPAAPAPPIPLAEIQTTSAWLEALSGTQ
jgi:phosphinothricin acetyltransferase